jgi:proteasome lid subunit RPN8/RPN11
MSDRLVVNEKAIVNTLEILQRAGRRHSEGVALWLGDRGDQTDLVRVVYEPIHHADADHFHIPPHGIDALMRALEPEGLSVVAQVHSHPALAFHSPADDEWAIVRHVGAFSIVLPNFGARTELDTFCSHALTFRLSSGNRWCEVKTADLLELTK